MVLESSSGKRLLIDCGTDIRHSLTSAGFSHLDIDGVYISHFHADHIGGLEWLAFTSKFDPKARNTPKLFIHTSMIADLWNHALAAGLKSLKEEHADINSYFDPQPLINKDSFTWESIQFQLVRTVHVYDGDRLAPSYGLFITDGHKNIFISTDTQFKPTHYMEFYQKADVIYHDCDICEPLNPVHSNFVDLITLDADIKSKMWLYHYSDNTLPNAKEQGFRGFVECGQVFEF